MKTRRVLLDVDDSEASRGLKMERDPSSALRLGIRPLSSLDPADFLDVVRTIPPEENSFTNEAFGLDDDGCRRWLLKRVAWSQGRGLPEGFVPETTYWFLVDGRGAGLGKLRRGLTPSSRVAGGNIGYTLLPTYRGRGYGRRFLAMLIEEARAQGIGELLFTVVKGNIASRRVIERNGGELIRENESFWYFRLLLDPVTEDD